MNIENIKTKDFFKVGFGAYFGWQTAKVVGGVAATFLTRGLKKATEELEKKTEELKKAAEEAK